MSSCLASARYTMLCDVYDKTVTLDINTNEMQPKWVKSITGLPCYVWAYINGGIHGAGTGEKFRDEYTDQDFLRLRTQKRLNKRQRVTNIRTKTTGVLIFADEEDDGGIGAISSVYNVDGTSPLTNPLSGKPSEYLTTLSRAEVRGSM